MSDLGNIKERFRTDPVYWIACGFGAGLVRYAPGTAGTAVAVPIVWLLQMIPLALYAMVTVTAFVVGIWVCQRVSDDLGENDHSAIVWDEIVGYMITMIAAPDGVAWLLIGFGLFRLLDILKPWPICWIDRHVSGGMGIMADDVLAGVASGGLLLLISTWG